ncbi:MAG: hypothetical protein KBD50_00610 [Candidatus Pacebacteria bacterium]|nr:hypothetical protein [Candidatus Paceibacterota bacterium]
MGHIGALYPLPTALCLAALGLVAIVGDTVVAKVADPIAAYCKAPEPTTFASVPVSIQPHVGNVCACLEDSSSKSCRGSV